MRQCIGKWVLRMLLWFWAGGVYFLCEVVWKTLRGRPESISWTMYALAVILAVPLERFGAELPWKMPLEMQAFVCATAITATEFLAGCALNLWLGLGVWDYSAMPGNLIGQVCPEFWGVWFLASVAGIVILDWLRYAVEGGERPRYRWR